MIRQQFSVDGYWEVVVIYNLDCSLLFHVREELYENDFPPEYINEVLSTMCSEDAKAVTCSNISRKTSIVLFNPHNTAQDYLNSIAHEAEHIKQAMLQAYKIEDKGEPPAYTIGYLVGRMWEVFKHFICTKENS